MSSCLGRSVGFLETECRREAVSGVYEDKERESGGAKLLFEKRCVAVKALFCRVDFDLG